MIKKQDELIGMVLENKYFVMELLSQGGISKWYRVKDIRDNKIWIMNFFDKKFIDKENESRFLSVRKLIIEDYNLMVRLNHPAVPYILDMVENENYFFVVREYIKGDSLSQIVESYGVQSVERVIDWGKQLCDFLSYMHHFMPPLIHGDMKPLDIILMPNGQLKVMQFQTVIEYGTVKKERNILPTRGFSAPEQYSGNLSIQTDIYTLGMIMYYLVTGKHQAEPPYEVLPICLINPELPKGLEYIILKCIQKRPEKRYSSCYELMNDLNNYTLLPKSKGVFSKLFKK